MRRAINYVALNGKLAVGDLVLLNTVAVEMKLGTGGYDFVVAAPEKALIESEPSGHIIKLRYTPLQMPVLAIESPESPHHEALSEVGDLEEIPVICAELHSQIPVICSAIRWAGENGNLARAPRVVYIMSDSAALPMVQSQLIPQLKSAGLLFATITCGQAFGGDYEAINIYSALAAAKKVLGAEIIVVSQGPGSVGTDTALGFSGVDQGLAINATSSLNGVPIVVPRISFADPRNRHYGISHHTITILKHIALAPTLVAFPLLPDWQKEILRQDWEKAEIAEEHQPITIQADKGLESLEATGISVSTMGRNLSQELPFFLSASAAGLLATQLLEARS